MRALLAVTALLLATSLAGCGGKGAPGIAGTLPPLAPDKGAIAGLVIDDVYRPVPNALVLIEKLGLTATSDGAGQFSFTGLEPGAYVVKVQAEGHAAAPRTIDIVAGEYTEAEIQADRLFNEGSRIVTTEYSVFIPCALDYVANGNVVDCTFDLSGDSFRSGFEANYTGYGNVTYLVTEMLANKEDRYEVQVRCETDEEFLYYAVDDINGRYSKMVMKLGEANTENQNVASFGENLEWNNDCTLHTILFADSQFREELQDAGAPVCCGAGAHFGIEAKFVQSLFLGAPEMPIESYSTLKPS